MATISSVLQGRTQILSLLLFFVTIVVTLSGCVRETKRKGHVFRESQNSVKKFDVKMSDSTLRVVEFVKLKDDSIIYPTMYYLQGHKTLKGYQKVEKIARTFQTISPNTSAFIYLPSTDEIASYLLLIRKASKKKQETEESKTKTIYEWSDWQLLEIEFDSSSEKGTITIPAFEDLQQRKIDAEMQKTRSELVKRFDSISIEARKKAGTPVKAGDPKPWWRE